MRIKVKKKGVLFYFLVSFVFFGAIYASAEMVDRIVAVVNGKVITLVELEERAAPVIKQLLNGERDPLKEEAIKGKILAQMIDDILAGEEAKRLGVVVDDRDVELAIEGICKDNGITKEELEKKLKAEGFTMEQYRKDMKQQIERARLINAQVRSKIVVTDEEIEKYLQENRPSAFSSGDVYVLYHIVFGPEDTEDKRAKEAAWKKARKALAALDRGESFAKVAAKYSIVESGKEGGLLGSFRLNEMASFIKEAVKDLKPGEHTPILETPVGLQIVMLKKIEHVEKASISETEKEEIRKKLYKQKIDTQFKKWIGELRNKATIKIML